MEGERGRGGGTPDTSPQRARNEPHNFGPFSVQGAASRMSQRIRYTAGSCVPGVRVCLSIFNQVRSLVMGRVRTRHISPRQSPSHYARAAAPGPAQAAGGTRPAARGPSFSPLAHLLRPPSSRRAVPPACLSDIRLPPILYRKSARERECRDEDGDIGMPVQRFHTPQQPSLPPGPPCAPLTRALSNMLVVCICQPALPPSLPSPLLHSHYIFRARRAYRCDSQNSP